MLRVSTWDHPQTLTKAKLMRSMTTQLKKNKMVKHPKGLQERATLQTLLEPVKVDSRPFMEISYPRRKPHRRKKTEKPGMLLSTSSV